MRKKVFPVLFFVLTIVLLSGCIEEDPNPKRYLQVPVYSTETQFLGSKSNALDTWTQDGVEFYHVRFRDYNELFLFDCIASEKPAQLISGFSFSNLSSGELSAVTKKGVRGYSYITYCHAPVSRVEDPIRISFREYGEASRSKAYEVTGLYFTNTTIAYNAMAAGSNEVKKFEKGSWYKLTIYNNNKSRKVEVNLADGTNLVSEWKYVKLSSLGMTDGLIFELSSSAGDTEKNPALSYFCLDGIILEEK